MDIALKNELSELLRLHHAVEDFAAAHALPPRVVMTLDLCLTELVTNTISYGYSAPARHEILVRLDANPDEVEAVIEDDANPFDPRQRPEVDVTLPLEERPIGGLGIHLVRKMMDSFEYQRNGDRNIVRIRKKLS